MRIIRRKEALIGRSRRLRPTQALHFRDRFRSARARALKDAEDYWDVLIAIERLGSFLEPKEQGLHKYKPAIVSIARHSALSEKVPERWPAWHCPFSELYELVRHARNEAAHEGAYARHLTHHSIELALVLEDALTSDVLQARDFMVSEPVVANRWEPLSFIRQKMLLNSFSFLPVPPDKVDAAWQLVSDRALVRYLRAGSAKTTRRTRNARLGHSLEKAIKKGGARAGESSLLCA